jgi:3-oxoadipate CoA-transferase, beta subunit
MNAPTKPSDLTSDSPPSASAKASTFTAWTRDQMAELVARDIPEGSFVNLGIGQPTLVANHIPADREIILQSENGVLGMGPVAPKGEEDWDLVNAGKQAVTLVKGASFFHHADSFAMMRGGHLDFCVLGAFQVSRKGDLANWHTGAPEAIPAVGGAMDLAIGAKQVFVMMEHLTKKGESKLVEQCSYPLTGIACVKRVYSDIAVIELHPDGRTPKVLNMCPGLSLAELSRLSAMELTQ